MGPHCLVFLLSFIRYLPHCLSSLKYLYNLSFPLEVWHLTWAFFFNTMTYFSMYIGQCTEPAAERTTGTPPERSGLCSLGHRNCHRQLISCAGPCWFDPDSGNFGWRGWRSRQWYWWYWPQSYRGKPWRTSIPEFYARINGTVLEEKQQIVCKVQNFGALCEGPSLSLTWGYNL